MNIFAIDPGPEKSAWLQYDPNKSRVIGFDIDDNYVVLDVLSDIAKQSEEPVYVVIEFPECFGMPVGRDIFKTCYWIGRFAQVASQEFVIVKWVSRSKVKETLCRSMRARDSNIRAALIDRFGPGKEKAIGTKKNPGPLYGIKRDVWSALAIAVTFAEKQGFGNKKNKSM